MDDAGKILGEVGKFGGAASGIVGFFNPESTATDEEMGLQQLNKAENQQDEKVNPQKIFEPQSLGNIEIESESLEEIPQTLNEESIQLIQNETEKEKVMSMMKDNDIDKPSFLPNQLGKEKDIQMDNSLSTAMETEEKERIMLAMRDSEVLQPSFLNDIERNEPPLLDIEIGEPSLDGDSDGGDGGDGGGDGGE